MSVRSFTTTLIDDHCVPGNTIPNNCSVIEIEPESLGRLTGTHIAVTNLPASLCDLVPLARSLASRIGDDAIIEANHAGHKVACRKGCAACCSYLVPLSAPEALYMGREIGPLSESSDPATVRTLTTAANRIVDQWPASPFAQTDSTDESHANDIEAVGQWYASLNLPCAFLNQGACTIYNERPLACQEHLVWGSSAHCDGFQPGLGNSLEAPVKVLDALGQLAAELEQTEVQAVMMPLVPFWYEENRHRALQTWNGPELVSRFLDCLADTTAQTASVPEAA